MARKKKDGKRAVGIQGKSGMLYVVETRSTIKDGKKAQKIIWTATGLQDKPENVSKAIELRERLLNPSEGIQRGEGAKEITLAEYIDNFLDMKKRTIADTTYAAYLQRGARIKEFFPNIPLRRVKLSEVDAFLDYLFSEKKMQPRTVKDIRTFFNTVMSQAKSDNLIPINPVEKAELNRYLVQARTKAKGSGEDFFSYTEANNFLRLVEDHELYELFYFTLFFGLRREEILGLQWKSISLKRKTLIIEHTVTKGTGINRLNATKTETSKRTYPLTDEQVMILYHLKKEEAENRKLFGREYIENDYVFKHQDGSLYYPDYPSKAFSKVIKAHPELPQGITFHGLRVSCVSILVHENVDVKRIQEWVGHADIETTLKIYARVKGKESKLEVMHGMQNLIQPKKYAT